MLRSLTAVCAALLVLVPTATAASMSHSESTLLREINRVRTTHGLRPLHVDSHLERAARAHTRSMLEAGRFAHGSFATRMQRFDVKAQTIGENLAWGANDSGTARAIVKAWLASPEHRANLLAASFTRIGVADLVGTFAGYSDAHVVTADFAG